MITYKQVMRLEERLVIALEIVRKLKGDLAKHRAEAPVRTLYGAMHPVLEHLMSIWKSS